ncbi:MAG TPA: IclR family transcriptional regulator [Chloroflexota bacterium]|nr:IclR family transcriptional regulator [Chloroflexota bacterium]
MSDGRWNSTTQAVQKAIALLNCFASSGAASLSVTELSAMVDRTPSSVSRLLSALETGQLVQRDSTTGRYSLGVQLVALAGAALASNALYRVGHSHLIRLAASTGETANLCVLEGWEVLTIDEVQGSQPIKLSGWIGMRHPLHATASGKVLLAALPAGHREMIAAAGLTALTAQTLTAPERLLREVERVQVEGYALTMEELAVGLAGVAAPVRDYAGKVVAALTIGGPSFRIASRHLADCITLVKAEAAEASRELGNPGTVNVREEQGTRARGPSP